MKINAMADGVCGALILGMFGWAAATGGRAPERFPVHWNLAGQVDRMGGRFEGMWLLPIVALLLWLLLLVLPRIDPGRANYANFASAYATIRVLVVSLQAAIYAAMQRAARGRPVDMGLLVPLLLGLLLLILGNLLGKVRPNWFVGIRTPWTLSSAESWNRTHRAGGWVFVAAGLLMIASGFAPTRGPFVGALGLLLAGVAGLVVYSYAVWARDPDKVPPAGRTAV